ncbi:MAG: Na/Pi cotransporter family protein [Desulfobacteraceae bacterium]
MDINWLQLCYALVGGLGMFIYGMKLMSDGLQKSAGNSLKMILEKLTSNRVIGAFVGLVVTAIIQSSSATTVMVVGFVNAGLMNLMQALSVVLGANIGTTITAQIIAFKVSQFALPAIGIGVVMRLFIKGKKTQSMGEILLGFGFLFLGMEIMTKGFAPLNHNAAFKDAFVMFSSNPLLAVAAGAILTMVVQSSSATIGITIALATIGVIDYMAASALVLGENIGTTITANLAAIGTNKAARRAALGHFLFNLIGVSYMVLFLPGLMQLVDAFTPGAANMIAADGTRPNLARHIANVHTTFNIINTLIFLPILPYLARLCEKIIKGDDTPDSFKLIYLKEVLVETPTIAVVQAIKEVKRMSDSALAMLKLSKDAFFERNLDKINKIYELEESVDLLQKKFPTSLLNSLKKILRKRRRKPLTGFFMRSMISKK